MNFLDSDPERKLSNNMEELKEKINEKGKQYRNEGYRDNIKILIKSLDSPRIKEEKKIKASRILKEIFLAKEVNVRSFKNELIEKIDSKNNFKVVSNILFIIDYILSIYGGKNGVKLDKEELKKFIDLSQIIFDKNEFEDSSDSYIRDVSLKSLRLLTLYSVLFPEEIGAFVDRSYLNKFLYSKKSSEYHKVDSLNLILNIRNNIPKEFEEIVKELYTRFESDKDKRKDVILPLVYLTHFKNLKCNTPCGSVPIDSKFIPEKISLLLESNDPIERKKALKAFYLINKEQPWIGRKYLEKIVSVKKPTDEKLEQKIIFLKSAVLAQLKQNYPEELRPYRDEAIKNYETILEDIDKYNSYNPWSSSYPKGIIFQEVLEEKPKLLLKQLDNILKSKGSFFDKSMGNAILEVIEENPRLIKDYKNEIYVLVNSFYSKLGPRFLRKIAEKNPDQTMTLIQWLINKCDLKSGTNSLIEEVEILRERNRALKTLKLIVESNVDIIISFLDDLKKLLENCSDGKNRLILVQVFKLISKKYSRKVKEIEEDLVEIFRDSNPKRQEDFSVNLMEIAGNIESRKISDLVYPKLRDTQLTKKKKIIVNKSLLKLKIKELKRKNNSLEFSDINFSDIDECIGKGNLDEANKIIKDLETNLERYQSTKKQLIKKIEKIL
ncbi:MAG: hypothetical protein BTN85_2011 [Candidatus Methanohalarchaeum thermophilum]|uniref:Uncharacterized protein n=1 Tax=Methanohalarchaeum thermophilum TaxID=1903181 RepID=A0A1Q6DSQ1_METT1|nr:MAG: hypothetical protein BTN85_2011 [Candidatus Methanohalarchaeum thermophilum]